MKKFLAILTVCGLVICLLAGCGSQGETLSATLYATTCAGVDDGEEYEYFGDRLVLKEDGTGTFYFDDMVLGVDYKLSGTEFSFTDEDGDEFTGTYTDGVVIGAYMDTYAYTFEAIGNLTDAPVADTYWSVAVDDGLAETLETNLTLSLNPDGTGTLDYYEVELDVVWQADGDLFRFWDSDSDSFDGVLTADALVGDYCGATYTFTSDEETHSLTAETANVSSAGVLAAGNVNDSAYVEILGAEESVSYDGEPVIRFYYNYTNTGDTGCAAHSAMYLSAIQDDTELSYGVSADELPENGYEYLDVLPGCSIRCYEEYLFDPEGGSVVFSFYDLWEETEVAAEFDLANLPGAPAEDYVFPVCDSYPEYEELPAEGVFDEDWYLSIGEGEVVPAWYDDESVIRVYFDLRNDSAEYDETFNTFFFEVYYTAFQDGVELESGYAKESVDEEANANTVLDVGDSVTCAECWKLRSDSPVLIVCTDLWDSCMLVKTYPVA